MTDTDIPDPADNKPSQAEGSPGDEQVEPAVEPAGTRPSQAEGAPEDQDVGSPGSAQGSDPARGGAADGA